MFETENRRPEVIKMQYELLNKKFNDGDANAPAVDLIKSMADGTGVHRAGALKFGLREGFSRASPKPSEIVNPPPFGGVQSTSGAFGATPTTGLFGTSRSSVQPLSARRGKGGFGSN